MAARKGPLTVTNALFAFKFTDSCSGSVSETVEAITLCALNLSLNVSPKGFLVSVRINALFLLWEVRNNVS